MDYVLGAILLLGVGAVILAGMDMLRGPRRDKVYTVTVHLSGRHPYLQTTEYDKPTRDVKLTIVASSWNDAEQQALVGVTKVPDWWTAQVSGIEYAQVIQ